MRLALHGANPAEWLALRAGVVPNAAAEAWGGMALSGILIAAVRTGVTARLAQQPRQLSPVTEVRAALRALCGVPPVPAVAVPLALENSR